MTRTDDTFIPLDERVRFARQRGAQLFISVHADWLPRNEGDAQGATVYTLSDTASDATAARLAEAENRADAVGGVDLSREPSDVADILFDLAQRETKNYSQQFAKTLVGEMKPVMRLHQHPLKSAGFKVLKSPDVPSVLVELGYVSNKADLKALLSDEWRNKAAGTIVKAVDVFFGPRMAGKGDGKGQAVTQVMTHGALFGPQFRHKNRRPERRQWPQRVRSCKISQNLAVSDVVGGGERAPGRLKTDGFHHMKLLLRFFGFLFAAGTILFLVGIAGVAGMMWHYSKDLPDYSQLQDYEPPVMTRVHATDGSLLAEYAKERRLYLPIQAVPKMVINAFISAEDKNFYEHGGLDFQGIARAGVLYAQNFGSQPPPAGRVHDHAAGREKLPSDQRGVLHPQDQGSAARDEDRADLFEREDPRTLPERNLSRLLGLRRRGVVASVFRQVGA